MPSLANGEVEGAGDAASWTGTFSCHPSFALVGSTTLKCRNGQWSSPRKPVCTGQYLDLEFINYFQVSEKEIHFLKFLNSILILLQYYLSSTYF